MNPDIRVGGSWRSITRGEVFLGGSWRTLTRGEIYKGGAWHPLFTFVPPMTAVPSRDSVFGNVSSAGTARVDSQPVTVTPSGGLAPYSYSWSSAPTVASFPTSATSYFSAYVAPADSVSATAVCTVTDSLGATATASVTVDLTNFGRF